MTRLSELKAELARLRKELEFIEGQLTNERFLGLSEFDSLADLSLNDIDKLQDKNEELMTRVIQLETLLECL